eukprot:TRINITY_DN3859_c0_g1_i2.p1 TRINITY_DN3859_c0_g1~~TRINITY_DN3859_c0_g1_i2.p1  ORF type:complete len:424 (+),score=110.37 TRINITY_DN3859_c0_g1_i2:167-1438(+)
MHAAMILLLVTSVLAASDDYSHMDCASGNGEKIELAGAINSRLCRADGHWELADDSTTKCNAPDDFSGGRSKACAAQRVVVKEINETLADGVIPGLIERRLAPNEGSQVGTLSRFIQAMAYSYNFDSARKAEVVMPGQIDKEVLPASDRVKGKGMEVAAKYKEKFGESLPTFFKSMHKNDVASAARAQFAGGTLKDRALLSGLASVTGKGSHIDQLRTLLAALWSEELQYEHVDYHRRKNSVEAAVESSGYAKINFGYGRTYYHSFLQLVENTKELRAAVDARKPMVVLGSSLGWQAFYTALTYDVPVTGYELLGPRVQIASKAAEQAGLDSVQFVHGDALEAKEAHLSAAGVIVLNDLLWDDQMLAKVFQRIATLAPKGCVMVSNKANPEVFRDSNKLTHVATTPLKVSWSADQRFYVHIVN